ATVRGGRCAGHGTRIRRRQTASSTACRSKPRCLCLTTRSTHRDRTRTRTAIAGTRSDSSDRYCCWSFIPGRKNLKTACRPAASSVPVRPLHTKGEPMKKGTSKRLTPKQRAELKSLAALADDAIDTSDAPELPDWSGAKRGLFYRPVK